MPQHDLHEANRLSWNAATVAHNSHKGDQAAFFREGGTTLYAEETALLGDIRDKALIHLQCNSGQDTLSIAAHLGATVTGVDISDEAITFAQQLATDSGIPATFVRSDIYDFFGTTTDTYDVSFQSYGAIVWLSDLAAWGRGLAKILKPGGRAVVLDFHPTMMLLDERHMTPRFSSLGGTHMTWDDGIGDYVAMANDAVDGSQTDVFRNPHPSHEFGWGVSDIVTALLDAGLTLSTLREYPFSNGFNYFPAMIHLGDRRFALPPSYPQFPMMLGVIAHKPEA